MQTNTVEIRVGLARGQHRDDVETWQWDAVHYPCGLIAAGYAASEDAAHMDALTWAAKSGHCDACLVSP